MRSLTKYQAFDHRVLMYLAGQTPLECRQIAAGMNSNVFDVRASLLRLLKTGHVVERTMIIGPRSKIVYERAHGGYSPDPEAA